MDAPVYIQIHNAIRADIEAGKWRVGDRIPSERDLAVTFKVSRMTLRQAIQTLVDEGILERRVGSGTYVANQKVQEKMSGVTSFTDLMQAQGKVPSSKTVSYHVAQPTSSEVEKDKQARLKDGTLAGSVLMYKDAFKNAMSFMDASLFDAVEMSSVNQAREFNLTSKGTLEVGKDADINVLDRNNDLVATYSYGVKHDTED